MFFGKRKNDKLPLQLPALVQPELPVPPSLRIMQVASLRSLAYGLLVANAISLICAGGFFALMLSRIEEIPYVADGSSYGCIPARQEFAPAAAEAPITPRTPVFEPLAPIEG
ncbi:hypothetical protein [Pontitalea aquivivens]|uniref:hypothetical protein n=1 Tax=Pontitalea aquivivens TaxID=3388663 RepID=UPI0039709E33